MDLKSDCLSLFQCSGQKGRELQNAVAQQYPNGECEKVSVSAYSTGPVKNDEKVVRLIFADIHIADGQLTSQAVSDLIERDLSTFRDGMAGNEELRCAINDIVEIGSRKIPPKIRTLKMILRVGVGSLRNIMVPETKRRMLRVYDTATHRLPSHASLFLTADGRAMSEKKIRRIVLDEFKKECIDPERYRDGALASS